jgi:hypothetical protein
VCSLLLAVEMGGSDDVCTRLTCAYEGLWHFPPPARTRPRSGPPARSPSAKTTKYDLLVGDEPIQYGGFKLFYRQDEPLLSPEQVLALDPASVVINYQ